MSVVRVLASFLFGMHLGRRNAKRTKSDAPRSATSLLVDHVTETFIAFAVANERMDDRARRIYEAAQTCPEEDSLTWDGDDAWHLESPEIQKLGTCVRCVVEDPSALAALAQYVRDSRRPAVPDVSTDAKLWAYIHDPKPTKPLDQPWTLHDHFVNGRRVAQSSNADIAIYCNCTKPELEGFDWKNKR